jgi:HEAT repeat protein
MSLKRWVKMNFMPVLSNLQKISIIIAAVIIVAIALWIITKYIIRRKSFIKEFSSALENNSESLSGFFTRVKHYNKKTGSKAQLIVKHLNQKPADFAKKIIVEIGLANFWIDRLRRKPVKKYFKNVLDNNIEDGLFICFKYALEKNSYLKYFKTWLEESKNKLPLGQVARSSSGENFNSDKAYLLLKDKEDEIREMLGDPDWKGRYFALKVLLKSDSTEQILRDLLKDPNPIIRQVITEYFTPADIDELKNFLFDTILNDPSGEVRTAALQRYMGIFNIYPKVDITGLTHPQIIHLIQGLRPGEKDDEAIATDLMRYSDLEIMFHAARFLEQSGTLSRYCSRLDLGDRDEFENKMTLLRNAASVGVTGFLKHCISHGSRESLLAAAEVLESHGDQALLFDLMKKIIETGHNDMYTQAVISIVKRGDKESKKILCDELYRNIENRELLVCLIESIAPLSDPMYIDPLINVLKERDDLVEITMDALLQKEEDTLIRKLIEIIKEGRKFRVGIDKSRSRLLINSMILLAKLKKDYCLSFIFENLSVLPVEFVSDFALILKKFPQNLLKARIKYYLGQIDGEIRSHIIALLPNTGIRDFHQEIRSSLNDADPLVRIAATFALVDINDTRALHTAFSLLRDPVEEVRYQVAVALGRTGKKDIIKKMKDMFFDKNEVTSVKLAIVRGVSESGTPEATGHLVDFLQKQKELSMEILSELKNHTGDKNISVLIEKMKDGSEDIKQNISTVFASMGRTAWPALLHLLESELSSLTAYAGSILDSTGGTEEEIKKLKNRNPDVRREAAKALSNIGTVKAFRGLIIASRDPDREVRINVVKALEKLETEEGKEILRALEEDPDTKIRKYTHWALERLKAKALV